MGVIPENGTAILGNKHVGVANIRERAYTLPDGSSQHGLTAQLFIEDDQTIVVGVGSVFQIGDAHYKVTDIKAGDEQHYGMIQIEEKD